MSPLHTHLQEYLAVRRALGFKLEHAGKLLPTFVAHLESHGASTVTTELALGWAKPRQDSGPAWWGMRLSMVRGFAKYLQAFDARNEIPAAELLPRTIPRPTPYLFSDSDIRLLLDAGQTLRPALRAVTYTTVLGLLAVTGLRIGEALRLDRQDVDRAHGLLVVRDSKFGKSRQVPLHATTVQALQQYVEVRDSLGPPSQGPAFFTSRRGIRLSYPSVQWTFRKLARIAALQPRSARCRPRLHDLRHSFAVRTVLRWYRQGLDVEARLPLLSTYLGHVDPKSTYWYLSAAPELMALAGQRLEQQLGRLP